MTIDFKKEIGQRLSQARKKNLGITIKELANRTQNLSPARISNWEQGTRSPGPREALELAKILGVSPAYLLCLTDEQTTTPEPSSTGQHFQSVSALTIDNTHLSNQSALGLKLDDDSMSPHFKNRDCIIINPTKAPEPGCFVIVFIHQKKRAVLRQYSECINGLYQLNAFNSLWTNITVTNTNEALILGVVIEHRHFFQS